MKLGFSTLGDLAWSLERFAEQLALAGYQCVEIRGRQGQHLGPEDSPEKRRDARKVFEAAGIDIAALTAYTRFTDPDCHAAQLDVLKSYLDLACDVGAGFVRTFGGDLQEGQHAQDAVALVADALCRVVEDAVKAGVVIVLETHDGFSKSWMVREVVERVRSPHVRALWDIHHPFRHGEPWQETFDNLQDLLGYVHVKDAIMQRDGSEQLVLLGAGRVPVEQSLRALAGAGFDGPVIMEWERAWHPELPDCAVAIPQHIQKIGQYLAGR